MKKVTRFTLLGAVALSLFACSKETKEVEDVSPLYNPVTKEVTTDFIFNVATRTETKQSADATQANSSAMFRGIENARLFAYAEEGAAYKGILPAAKDAPKVYDLAAVAAPASISSTNSRRVLELSLPVKTNVLLFYGKAPEGEGTTAFPNRYDVNGHLDYYTISQTPGMTNIQLGRRLSDSDYTAKFVPVENLFAGIMSMLLNSKVANGTVISKTAFPSGLTDKPYGFDITMTKDIYWHDYYATPEGKSPYNTANNRYPLEDKLYTLYKQLTTINTAGGELRAGSGPAILSLAKNLLTVLNEIRYAEPVSEEEAVAKYLAEYVYNRMKSYYSFADNFTGAPVTEVHFRSNSDIIAAYKSESERNTRPDYDSPLPAGFAWPGETELGAIASYNPEDFPFNFNLPRGATYFAFDSDSRMFYYPQTFNVSGMGLPSGTYNAKSYYYPAELIYFGNSPIRTSSSDKTVSNYPNGVTAWDSDDSWGDDWSGTSVVAATRAVAMKNNINYGVALLDTKVTFTNEAVGLGYVLDNNHAVQAEMRGVPSLPDNEEPDKHIPITTDGAFQLTGILIGNQSLRIGWDHLPAKIGDEVKYGWIYDKAIAATSRSIPGSVTIASTPTPTTASNYTLVFDNFKAASQSEAGIYTADTQDIVYVALELLNNSGHDFYGNHNIILNGNYFYLIGALKPGDTGNATSHITDWPTNYVIPPYTAEGASQQIERVFIQDFITSVTFKIGKDSLKSAYLTVPDLRSSSMNLGLSVDLNWRTGLAFDDVVLGAN